MKLDKKQQHMLNVCVPTSWVKQLRHTALSRSLSDDAQVTVSSLVREALAKTYSLSEDNKTGVQDER